jgi:phosphocarrier protein
MSMADREVRSAGKAAPEDQGEDRSEAIVRTMTICNKRGLHARASAKFVRCAEGFSSEITVSRDGQSVGGTSIMGLMMLAAAPGCSIQVAADGPDAEAALAALADLVECGFGEED